MEWAQNEDYIRARFCRHCCFACCVSCLYPCKKEPTCFDKNKNGTGVLIVAGAAPLCASEVKAPRVVWAKLSLGGNNYDLGAYVENANTNAGLKICATLFAF